MSEPTKLKNLQALSQAIAESATPYGDLTVVDRDNRISISSDVPLSEQRDNYTAGVTRLSNESVIRLRANAGTERIETVEQLAYSPGYTGEVGTAILIPEAPTGNQVVRFGYFGDADGIRWGWDATGVFIEDERNGTPNQTLRPDDWNGDVTGGEVRAALQAGTILRQLLSLYNFGSVEHEILTRENGNELTPQTVHRFGTEGQTTLSRQNNPITVEVENPASEDFDVFVADRQATIRGEFTASDRPGSQFRTGVSLSGTTWVPIMTIRIKPDFDTIPISLLQFSAFVSDNAIVQFRTDAGSTDDADYAPPNDTDPAETAVEVDTSPSASISDGFKRYQRLIPGGGQGNTATPLGELPEVDLDVKRDQPVTVYMRRVSGTGGTVTAANLQWQEGW